MPKQIHELAEAPALDLEDRVVVSTGADRLTRQGRLGGLPFKARGADTARLLRDKLGETVSVADFGAKGDGVADDAPAFEAALAAAPAVAVPAGRYRLASTVIVPPRRQIKGAGRDAAFIEAKAPLAFVFERNRGAHAIEPASATDWNRSGIAGLTVRMAAGGIRAIGHEFRAVDLNFSGGLAPLGQDDPDGWCLDMVDANECQIWGINAGYGGGSIHAMCANGLRWRSLTPGVNYGDSMVGEASFKLAAAGTAGVLIDGHGADAAGVVNNMILQRVQVNAPQGDGGVVPLPGTVGIKLWNGARVCLIDCDVEVVATAFEEYSERQGGGSGACVANTYVGCIAHHAGRNYKDSNGRFPGSVLQRTFVGCDNVAPLPTGNYAADGGRCQDGDAFMTGAWLFDAFGAPSVQLRSRDKGALLVTGDHKGATQADADGHPGQSRPYRGLLLELASKQAAKITRPVSLDSDDPDEAGEKLLDVRLELGNGEGDARGELARVQVNDPLYLTPRTTEPPRPLDGLIHYAGTSGALPATGEWYLGQGLYCRLSGGAYAPVAVQRGAVPEREHNGDLAIEASDFGKIVRVNHARARTVTVPAGLVPPGEGARRVWIVRQNGPVHFVPGDGMTLHSANDGRSIVRAWQTVEVVISYDVAHLNHVYPDAIEPFERRLKLTGGNVVASSAYLGALVRVQSETRSYVEIPKGLVPDGMEAVSLRLMKAGLGDVEVGAGPGMTLLAPGGVDPYLVTGRGKSVEVIVTGGVRSQQNNQPDHVLIVD